MDTHTQTTDSPDVAYGVTLLAVAPTRLSDAEKANVAQWSREASAQLRDHDAGVPTHCSKVIVELCRLVQQLSGEGFRA